MLTLLLALAPGPAPAPDTSLKDSLTVAGYWQQQVSYRITASLAEASGVLIGRARIAYVNHSPDTLRDFFVHQYLNAFRPGSRWAAADSAERRERFQHLKEDRKSTRLNSSHVRISYSVFCLKKKIVPSRQDSTTRR